LAEDEHASIGEKGRLSGEAPIHDWRWSARRGIGSEFAVLWEMSGQISLNASQ
jgi:hypothetical protein